MLVVAVTDGGGGGVKTDGPCAGLGLTPPVPIDQSHFTLGPESRGPA